MSKPKMRALIVGCGRIAGGFDENKDGDAVLTHAGAYRRRGDVTIAACVDPDAGRRAAFMAYWEVAQGFAHLDEVREAGEAYDVVSVCSPNAVHASDLDILLAMPVKAVLCEKPLTDDLAECRRLVEAYERAGRPLGVHYLRRWDPAMARLKSEIAAGNLGDIQSVTAWYCQGLLHGGSHVIDLLRFLFGEISPGAVFRRRDCGKPNDPTVDGLVWAAPSVPVFLIGLDDRFFTHVELVVLGTKAVITIDQAGFSVRRREVESHPLFQGYRRLTRGDWEATGLDQAVAYAVDNMVEVARGGAVPECTARDALRAQEVCEALASMPLSAAPPSFG